MYIFRFIDFYLCFSFSLVFNYYCCQTINRDKRFCLHNICVCTVYIYYVYKYTHMHVYILKIFTCTYLYSYELYHI